MSNEQQQWTTRINSQQITFASTAWSAKGRTTRRERFLAEMNAVIPWARLIEPHSIRRAKNGRQLIEHEKLINRSLSRRRARGEFVFHVVKRLWGFAKTRYRGIYKNTVRALTMV